VISTDGGRCVRRGRGERPGLVRCRLGVIASANEKSRAHKVYAAGSWTRTASSTCWLRHGAVARRALSRAFIADGAEWIWRRVGLYFPECEQVLDIYHAAEHVASAAAALWARTASTPRLAHARPRHATAINGPKRVRRKLLAGWLSGNAVDPHALHKEIRYLFRHRRRMPYQALKDKGCRRERVMESASSRSHGQVARPGMKWTKQGADGMLRSERTPQRRPFRHHKPAPCKPSTTRSALSAKPATTCSMSRTQIMTYTRNARTTGIRMYPSPTV